MMMMINGSKARQILVLVTWVIALPLPVNTPPCKASPGQPGQGPTKGSAPAKGSAPRGNTPPSASSQVLAVSDSFTHDGVIEGVQRFKKECQRAAKKGGKLLTKFRKHARKAGKGLDPTNRTLQRGLLGNIRANKTLAKVGKGAKWLLDKINVVAVGARVLGHAVEGDGVGAVGVAVDETVKRGTTAIGTAAGTAVNPVVGSIGGAIAAEEVHQRVTRPWLQKKESELRTRRLKKKLYGDAITKRGKGEDPEPDPDEEPPDPSVKQGQSLLDAITPTLVHAKATIKVDMSQKGFKNVVTTTMLFRFFNVGALVPGYASATMKRKSVASLNGATEEESCRGRYTGGPNGALRLKCKDGLRVYGVHGGRVVKLGPHRASIDNPGAFAGWPK